MGRSIEQKLRLQQYKKNRLTGMAIEESAVAAGYSVKYARAKSYKIERSAMVGIKDALSKAGLTDDYLANIARKRIEKNEGITGFNYYQVACKMKGILVDKPLVDQSVHEHFTIQVTRSESIINADQRDHSQLQSDAQTDNSVRSISLT